MGGERTKCTVESGLFVRPCKTLDKAVDNDMPGFSRKKGIFVSNLTNINTGQPSRTYFGIKTAAFPNGILFNNCPFCGAPIDAPFAEPDDPEAAE